jgi:hypothetical protein
MSYNPLASQNKQIGAQLADAYLQLETVAYNIPHVVYFYIHPSWLANWPSGKASVSGAGDRRFESCIGRSFELFIFC